VPSLQLSKSRLSSEYEPMLIRHRRVSAASQDKPYKGSGSWPSQWNPRPRGLLWHNHDNMVRIGLKETLLSLLFIGGGSCAALYNSSLPIIDLGYVKQQATEYNQTYDFYHFRNIRYAAPPLGDLRFRKPRPPLSQAEIQNGDISFVESTCHQTWPPFLGTTPFGEDFGVEDCLVNLLPLRYNAIPPLPLSF